MNGEFGKEVNWLRITQNLEDYSYKIAKKEVMKTQI